MGNKNINQDSVEKTFKADGCIHFTSDGEMKPERKLPHREAHAEAGTGRKSDC